VKLYFTLGQAMQSAAVATWQQKLDTNYARPVRVIRELSELGLLGDVDDLDPVTGISRFEAYSRDTYQTEMIDGTTWETYQNPSGGYSPPFAEYPSGHSTFSAAGGKVLALFTGDDFGGAVTGRGVFEPPTENEVVTLEWDTWQEAVEEAGFSRLYGGIHFDDGNLEGQTLGALIGEATFQTASQLWA
jgi:membrane-associated phospholipid phosphatase